MSPSTRRGLIAATVVALVPASGVICFLVMGGLGPLLLFPMTVATMLGSALIANRLLRRFRLVDPRAASLGTLFAGLLSPVLAATLGLYAYVFLTRASSDRDADFVLRLVATAAAMTLPFMATVAVAVVDRRHRGLGVAGKLGVALAVASLALTWVPINGLIDRLGQADHLALSEVQAPPFDTVDIHGERHRLSDHKGKVVLVNIWATWCGPCRREMPDLERLYLSRKDDGLMVFGLSTEDVEVQKRFAEEVVVSYPLLTVRGEVPDTYSQSARYPANFLIDRNGQLQTAPSVEKPFSHLEAAVDALLDGGKSD